MTTRRLTTRELQKIFFFCKNGYLGESISIRSNHQVYLIFLIQLNTGLRIGDVLSLKRKNFDGNYLKIIEQKTGKLQNRKINKEILEKIESYCSFNKIGQNDQIFSIKVRWVQKYLQKITGIIGINMISTHSFRKTYAHLQYINSNHNIELVRRLLNHSSISITQRYLGITDNEVDEASKKFKIIF